MSVESVTLSGRIAAESLMTDTCLITRPDPEAVPGAMDPDTMQYPDVARLTVYEGKCRLQVTSLIANSSSSDAGEREAVVQGSELQLPVDGTDGVSVRDTAKILTSAHDPALVDRTYAVVARHEKSHATARRLRVEAATG